MRIASTPGYNHPVYAGCYYDFIVGQRIYLPLLKSSFHTTIFSDRQQTTIKQTFTNSTQGHIASCKYNFPIYEGVSVTSFTCEVADRKLIGIVKEKSEAKAEYDAAVSQGIKAGLLEQSDTSDVFSTSLGNVEIDQDVHVTITYIGELKNNLDSDNIRLTIPTIIAPRYGSLPENIRNSNAINDKGMDISIDVIMPEEKPIQGLESPSHPISVSLGRLSVDAVDQVPSFSKASAVLSQTSSGLEKDFVFLVKAKDTGSPTAVLQTHSTLQNYRSLMVSLVPKFSLPSIRPEIVFVADRSGSMASNISMLKQALNVFLKSMPAGVKFNICSFGSHYSFLWPKSQDYTKDNLATAVDHVRTFGADYGGTNTLFALQATIANRYSDIPLEIILLTDGDIWAQEVAFDEINKAVVESKHQIRLFPLGIGDGVSHALIEGLSRAGNGFAQAVQINERIDTRVVRMLKAALTPHISNYTLEVKYNTDDDFELIEAVNDCLKIDTPSSNSQEKQASSVKPSISLFDASADPDEMDTEEARPLLPAMKVPKLLQAPHNIPSLYSFSRTTVYILMSPDTVQRNPTSVILKGESEHGPLQLEIPVTILDVPGEVISQLAARKAVQDLEEHRGWVYHATNSEGKKLVELYPSRAAELIQQEAVRLGTTYGIANKWCSFIAVDADSRKPPDSTDEQLISEEEFDLEYYDGASAPGGASMSTQGNTHTKMKRKCNRAPGWRPMSVSSNAAQAAGAPTLQQLSQYSLLQPQATGASMQSMNMSSVPNSAPTPPMLRARPRQLQQQLQQQPNNAQYAQYAQQTQRQSMPQVHFASAAPSHPPQAKKRTLQTARKSTGGAPPRKQLASKAARIAPAPTTFPLSPSSSSPPQQTPTPLPISTPTEKVHALISLQDFDGFWSASEQITQILGVTDAQANLYPGNVWVTALVVAYLRKEMGGEREIWEMVVDKAVEWLAARKLGKEDVMREAERLF